MRRRQFLALGLSAGLARAQQRTGDTVTATATQDKTPRVGIVLSSFNGSADHDGTPIPGLADPRPRSAKLTDTEVEAMVRRAIEIGDKRSGDLRRLIASDEWAAIKVDLNSWPGRPGYVRGMATDPRIVAALISWLVEKKSGGRFTVADAAPDAAWNADFGGLSYRRMIANFTRRYPQVRFEIQDFNCADSADTPVPGKDRSYRIPSLIQQADRLITVAPLQRAMANYLSLTPGQKDATPEVIVDLFSYHPADYAIAAGPNLVVAGFSAMAVDAVSAAIGGIKPETLPLMKHAWKRGFGIYDVDSIWTRGNQIEEARR